MLSFPSEFPQYNNCTIAVIGLGYVGLPLAVAFAGASERSSSKNINRVIGFDINKTRIADLKNKIDRTHEVSESILQESENIVFTSDIEDLNDVDVFLVTVPTPIDKVNRPDLSMLGSASQLVGKALNRRSSLSTTPVVIYESTVYPGATEEFCIPLIEQVSGYKLNKEFYCGYSPERINPGDKNKSLSKINKVVGASTSECATWMSIFYQQIIEAKVFITPSIKVAEAAKVIENTQRDVNIALINEFAMIFDKLNIDTLDVLEAAETKWNFLAFKPGLVGGHCIGVDPYYLTHKAEEVDYHPQVVLAGRRINDNMSFWITQKILKKMASKKINIVNANALIMGFTFKANCPDIRNTKVFDVYSSLMEYGMSVSIYDPIADPKECSISYDVNVLKQIPQNIPFDIILFCVDHDQFKNYTEDQWLLIDKNSRLIFDIKGIVPKKLNPTRI